MTSTRTGLMARVARQTARRVLDLLSGRRSRFACRGAQRVREGRAFEARLDESQLVLRSALWENKLRNLELAASCIENVSVRPGELFSFWHLVGNPAERRGFVLGRSLQNGAVHPTVGGGLCQLSGLLYGLALRGGLEIVERHPHSVDLYGAGPRPAPLGVDATVVFGRKDFRFRNPLPFPVSIRFRLSDTRVTASLCAPAPLPVCVVTHRAQPVPDGIEVVTERIRQGLALPERIACSTYRRSATAPEAMPSPSAG